MSQLRIKRPDSGLDEQPFFPCPEQGKHYDALANGAHRFEVRGR